LKSDFNERASLGTRLRDAMGTDPLTLDRLAPDAVGVVVGVRDGDDPIDRRLLDLGLLPGTEVRVLRRAPLGDPVEYELRGYRLCLRRSEAERVRVRPATSAPAEEPA
jgi:Fe2+ transport system protein FeoA